MILSDRDLAVTIAAEGIIFPVQDDAVQPASIDVYLDDRLRKFRVDLPFVDPERPLGEQTYELEIPGEGYMLQPREFVLASTVETVRVPDSLVAMVEGVSTLGRCGLLVHITAGLIDPGFHGTITLEVYNVNSLPIRLMPGMRIAQVTFEQLTSPAARPYEGRYQGQRGPTAPRMPAQRQEGSPWMS